MNSRMLKIACTIGIVIIMSCNYKMAISETTTQDVIKSGDVQKSGDVSLFIIKFSNLIFEKNGIELKVPIFQGYSSDVHYKSFLDYCYKNNLLKEGWGESAFVIKADKGKLTKTFREFLMFYKGNILKDSDITKPAKMIPDGGALDIYYDFQVDGIPFVLQVNISTDKDEINPGSIKSIFDVNLDENMKTPMFTYRF